MKLPALRKFVFILNLLYIVNTSISIDTCISWGNANILISLLFLSSSCRIPVTEAKGLNMELVEASSVEGHQIVEKCVIYFVLIHFFSLFLFLPFFFLSLSHTTTTEGQTEKKKSQNHKETESVILIKFAPKSQNNYIWEVIMWLEIKIN